MSVPAETGIWRKSSRSKEQDCVEVKLDDKVGVRDTKDRDGGQLAVPSPAWTALLNQLRN